MKRPSKERLAALGRGANMWLGAIEARNELMFEIFSLNKICNLQDDFLNTVIEEREELKEKIKELELVINTD